MLLSGRWYSAGSLQGPWQYVASNQLPAPFAQIPADSPKADVLPFVALGGGWWNRPGNEKDAKEIAERDRAKEASR